jgi:hypothetical protein
MGILSGLLGPAINVATNAMAAHEGADAASAVTKINFARQQQQDQVAQVLRDRQAQMDAARMKLLDAQTTDTNQQVQIRQHEIDNPKPIPIDPNSAEVFERKKQLERDKIEWERTHGYHAPPPPGVVVQDGVDPTTGKPAKVWVDLRTHQGGLVQGVGGKAPGRGAGTTLDPTRKANAMAKARAAELEMNAFEDDLVLGKANIGTMDITGARTAMSDRSPITASVAEAATNRSNPRLLRYLRAAKQYAEAERLIQPRGGSNALMTADAMLSGIGTGLKGQALKDAITQARNARRSIYADEAGDGGEGGGGTGGTGPSNTSPMTPAERASLKSQGWTDEQLDGL